MIKRSMPAESFFGFDNVEDLIEKCVQKIRKVLEDCHFLDSEVIKELEEVIHTQETIKKRIKLVLENQGKYST